MVNQYSDDETVTFLTQGTPLNVEERKKERKKEVFLLIALFMIIVFMINYSKSLKSLQFKHSRLTKEYYTTSTPPIPDDNESRLYADLLARSITGLMLRTPGKFCSPIEFTISSLV